jgi:hypothetical protein
MPGRAKERLPLVGRGRGWGAKSKRMRRKPGSSASTIRQSLAPIPNPSRTGDGASQGDRRLRLRYSAASRRGNTQSGRTQWQV